MARLLASIGALVLAPTLAALPPASAQPEAADPFYGVYVGTAEVYDGDGTLLEERDIDIEISSGERSSLVITWTNVSLVNGQRDVPGVTRRQAQLTLLEEGDILIEDTRGSLFSGARDIDTMQGDAVRWGRFADGSLDVFAFAVLEDGQYRLHEYYRRLTDLGLDLEFQAWQDGELDTRIIGRAVRVD